MNHKHNRLPQCHTVVHHAVKTHIIYFNITNSLNKTKAIIAGPLQLLFSAICLQGHVTTNAMPVPTRPRNIHESLFIWN